MLYYFANNAYICRVFIKRTLFLSKRIGVLQGYFTYGTSENRITKYFVNAVETVLPHSVSR